MRLERALRVALRTGFIALAGFAVHSATHSASVQYGLTNVAGSVWRYDYSVIADIADVTFDELTIYFEAGATENLLIAASPVGWDSLVIQPDAGLPSDGFLDTILLSGHVPVEQKHAGFSVEFTLVGAGTPGAQRFELIDSASFSVVGAGVTALAPVPEPSAAALMVAGLLFTNIACRRRQSLPQVS